MITPRAYLFGFVGSCFYLIALVNTLPPFYYALTWLTAAVLASSLGVALLSLLGLTCQWRVARTRVSENIAPIPTVQPDETGAEEDVPLALQEGTGPTIDCTLANSGTLNKTDVIIEVQLHERWRDETLYRRFLLEVLPTNSSITTSLSLHDLPRGRYQVKDIRLIGSDVLGLFRMQKRIPRQGDSTEVTGENTAETAEQSTDSTANASVATNSAPVEIIVGPAMLSLTAEHSGQEAGAGRGGVQAAALVGQSDETRGTRPYVAGDDLRFVHWKSTARHGQLVVREFDRSSQRQAIVVWDGAAGTAHGEGNFSSREHGLRLAASLCRAFHEHGQPCGLLRLDSRPLWVPPAGTGLRYADSLSSMSESLADADSERDMPLLAALNSFTGNLKADSDLLLITASLSPSVVQTVQWCRAHGLRVVVGLIDGASFLQATETESLNATYDLLWRPVLHARTPQEKWATGVDGAGAAAVTAEAYRAQAAALREAGAHVAILAEIPEEEHVRQGDAGLLDPTRPVRTTLREMLELRRQPTVGNNGYASNGALIEAGESTRAFQVN